MMMSDIHPEAAQEIGQRLKEHMWQIKEIDNILQRPMRAKEKVARIMLPFFGKRNVVLEFIGAQEKSPRNWHSYLKKPLDGLMDDLRKCSPSVVRTELKNHIREIVVLQDGTITIHGTSQGILSRAGLVKAGELGTVELGPEPTADKKKPHAKNAGLTLVKMGYLH
jgi:hypothetical protein